MKSYQNLEYLKSLLENPNEFRKQSILSFGEVVYEMFHNNIIPPLSLLSSVEGKSSVAVIIAKINSHKYPKGEFKSFLSQVKNDYKKETVVKSASDFLAEVKPSMIKYLDEDNVEKKEDKINSLSNFFNAINELRKYIFDESDNYQKIREVQNALGKLSIDDLNNFLNNDEDRHVYLKLLEDNADNMLEIFKKNNHIYNDIKINDLVYSIVELNEYENIPDSIKKLVSFDLFIKKAPKSEENIDFIKKCMALKNQSDVVDLGLSVDNLSHLSMLDLKKDKQEHQKMALGIIKFASKEIISAIEFRNFIKNSYIAKLIPVEELYELFYKANPIGIEFKDELIWGEDSINSIVRKAKLSRRDSFSISDLYDYMREGRRYSDTFVKDIVIPLDFLQKLDTEITNNGGKFLYEKQYYTESTIYSDRESFQIQILNYLTNKFLKEIRNLETVTLEDKNHYGEVLSFLFLNFNSLTTRDTTLSSSNHEEPDRAKRLLEAIELENLIYDFSKEYFKISQNHFQYEDIEYLRKMNEYGNAELSMSFTSSLAQEIKNPNYLWAFNKNNSNNNLYSYSSKDVNLLAREGMPLIESLKSIFEFPLLNKDNLVEKISSLEGYSSNRNQLISYGLGKATIAQNTVLNIIDRNRFPEMSDEQFNIHLSSVHDFVNKNKKSLEFSDDVDYLKIIEDKQKSLGLNKNKKLDENYFFSLEYLHNNFSLDLLYEHLKYDKETLKKWYELKGESIDKNKVDLIINEVFHIFYNTSSYKYKKVDMKILLEVANDFIFNFISLDPSTYENLKEEIITGPYGKNYESFFKVEGINVIKELIESTDNQRMRELYKLATFEEIKENIGKILSSKNIELIQVLLKEMPNKNFEKLFNTCTYKEQRIILSESKLLENFISSYRSNEDETTFNPENFEEFKEVFDYLRLRSRKLLLSNQSNNENANYYETMKTWEFAEVLKNINVPKINSVINYLIEEVPLSFVNEHYMSSVNSYGGLPRALEVNEFIKLIDNINKKIPGLLYIGDNVNDRNQVYDALFKEKYGRDKNSLDIVNKNFDKYIKALEKLKSNPKDYVQMVVHTQNIIERNMNSFLKSEREDTNDFHSKLIYSWKKIPEKLTLLNEIQSVFDSRYNFIDKINARKNNTSISQDEFFHKFFNIFVDKQIYIEGIKMIKEETLLNTGFSNKAVKDFRIKCLYPYSYEIRREYSRETYTADYTPDELDKLSRDLVSADQSLFFDRNLPKTKVLIKTLTSEIVNNNESNYSLTDSDYANVKNDSFIDLIDKYLNNENIWSYLLAINYNESYSKLDYQEYNLILNNILEMPDLNSEMLSKISFLLELQEQLRDDNNGFLCYADNNMLRKLSEGLISCLSASEIKNTKILVESMIMEKEILLNDKKVKKSIKF